MTEFVTPRVNKELMARYVGGRVRLIGKVQQAPANGHAILLASDNAPVTVHTLPTSNNWTDEYLEVIGTVKEDLSLDEIFSTNFGNSFNLENHNAVVVFADLHYEMFK